MATQYTITGVIEGSDGSRSEFMMLGAGGSGSWNQWGPISKEQLGDRVEYLDAMASGLSENSDYYDQAPEDDEESDDEEEAGE